MMVAIQIKKVTTFILICLIVVASSTLKAQNDLAGPWQSMQYIPTGSLVIGMDNSTQAVPGRFNLKSYGLVNKLLQAGIPVKWAIRSGKLYNGIDFTATVQREYPTIQSITTLNFRSGPFIVDSAHANLARAVIGPYANDVAVYRVTQWLSVDIRYRLIFKPNIAVLSNGGNQNIHISYLQEAGFIDSIWTTTAIITPADTVISGTDTTITPEVTQTTTHYGPWVTVIPAVEVIDWGGCYTFASEPHWDAGPDTLHTYAINRFLLNGSNFLAQCEGVETYEDDDMLMTTGGIDRINANITYNYYNYDMPYAQFHGTLSTIGGSLRNWALSAGSSYHPIYYRVVGSGDGVHDVASGVKRLPNNIAGGNAFYLGGHDYGGGPQADKINGRRMYLNCIFVPADPKGPGASVNCLPLFPLPIELLYFDAQLSNGQVKLNWATASETNNNFYTIERSHDGHNFEPIQSMAGAGNSQHTLSYETLDENPLPGMSYYRLRQTDFDGKTSLSNIAPVKNISNKDIFMIVPNPSDGSHFTMVANSGREAGIDLTIKDLTGRLIYSQHIETGGSGVVQMIIEPDVSLAKGLYVFTAHTENGSKNQKVLVK